MVVAVYPERKGGNPIDLGMSQGACPESLKVHSNYIVYTEERFNGRGAQDLGNVEVVIARTFAQKLLERK